MVSFCCYYADVLGCGIRLVIHYWWDWLAQKWPYYKLYFGLIPSNWSIIFAWRGLGIHTIGRRRLWRHISARLRTSHNGKFLRLRPYRKSGLAPIPTLINRLIDQLLLHFYIYLLFFHWWLLWCHNLVSITWQVAWFWVRCSCFVRIWGQRRDEDWAFVLLLQHWPRLALDWGLSMLIPNTLVLIIMYRWHMPRPLVLIQLTLITFLILRSPSWLLHLGATLWLLMLWNSLQELLSLCRLLLQR